MLRQKMSKLKRKDLGLSLRNRLVASDATQRDDA
jgi:hypothetical protein